MGMERLARRWVFCSLPGPVWPRHKPHPPKSQMPKVGANSSRKAPQWGSLARPCCFPQWPGPWAWVQLLGPAPGPLFPHLLPALPFPSALRLL